MPPGNTDGYKTGVNMMSGRKSVVVGDSGNCSSTITFKGTKFKNTPQVFITLEGNLSSTDAVNVAGFHDINVPNASITKSGFLIWSNASIENYSAAINISWLAVDFSIK